jgi:hypothetical protein
MYKFLQRMGNSYAKAVAIYVKEAGGLLGLGIDNSVLMSQERDLSSVGNAKFLVDVINMIFHRMLADEQLAGNLFIAHSLGDQAHHFLFPWGQIAKGIVFAHI